MALILRINVLPNPFFWPGGTHSFFYWPRGTWSHVDVHIKGTCDLTTGGSPELETEIGVSLTHLARFSLPNVNETGHAFDFTADISSYVGSPSGAYATDNACLIEQASMGSLSGHCTNIFVETYELILYGDFSADPCTGDTRCCLEATPTYIVHNAEAFSGTITITASVMGLCSGEHTEWSAIVTGATGADLSWLHLTGADAEGIVTGTDDGTIDFTADVNTTGLPRTVFILITSQYCYLQIQIDQTAEGGSASDLADAECLESDSPRAWLHVGGAAKVQTYHIQTNSLNFSGTPALSNIRCLANDTRRGRLAILSETVAETTWKVYLSEDGGESAELVNTLTYKSATLAYDSERGALLLMGATDADAIEANISRDGGTTWEDPVAALEDDGSTPLTGQVKDLAHDPRADGVFALLIDTGSAKEVWKSVDAGLSWTLTLS